MTRAATVKTLLPNGNALIEFASSDPCSSDCVNCHGCLDNNKTFTAEALNKPKAVPGDRVTVETPSGTVIKKISLFYLIPVCLMVLIYCVLPFGESIKIIGAVAGFFAAFLIIRFLFVRVYKNEGIVFTIKEIMR
ncbi:MAG: SoxR reducing system RseC family protein [Clostridia bacterium]|nr:SoxR reducing system RseC family protein [Clostridia bacterium]